MSNAENTPTGELVDLPDGRQAVIPAGAPPLDDPPERVVATTIPEGDHPILEEARALAAEGYDASHVDLSAHLDDAVPRTPEIVGVKGPDPAQWGAEARAARGAEQPVGSGGDLPRY